jgi:uncharacterized membrane protein
MMLNSKRRVRGGPHGLLHEAFEIGIFLKGIDGFLEIISGGLLFLLTPTRVNQLVHLLTQHELSEDPKDFLANYFVSAAQHFSVSAQLFDAVYLLSHGIIKIALVTALWKRRLWAYPIAIVFFALFGAYQVYQYTHDHAASLILLTILDVAVILLTWHEYNTLRRRPEQEHL